MITMIIPDDYKCYLSELHALFKAHDGILLTNAGRNENENEMKIVKMIK